MIFLMTPKFEWNGVRRVRKRHRNRINCAKPIKTSVDSEAGTPMNQSTSTTQNFLYRAPNDSRSEPLEIMLRGLFGNIKKVKKKKKESPLRPPIEGAKLVPEVGKNFGVEKLGNWEILDIILSVGKFLTPY